MIIDKNGKSISESMLIFIVGLVLFIDVIDFMMVMPLGPDIARALSVNVGLLGNNAGIYALAAFIAGLFSSIYLDKFDRKKSLCWSLAGLILANFACSLANSLPALMAGRFMAGLFGGPASAMAMAIITDVFPESRRGKAIGKVMGAISFAAIIGVPFGLKLSLIFSWKAPFIAVALAGIITLIIALAILPTIEMHKNQKFAKVTYKSLLSKPNYLLSYLFIFLGQFASFMIIPYISAHLIYDLSFPRTDIDKVYIYGGIISFFVMRIVGKLTDRSAPSLISMLAVFMVAWNQLLGFIFVDAINYINIYVIFSSLMVGMSIKNVTCGSLYSRVPQSHERAGFMAIINGINNIAAASGAFFSTMLLTQKPDGGIENIQKMSIIALTLFSLMPLVMWILEIRLKNSKDAATERK